MSKRMKKIQGQVVPGKQYGVEEALGLLKEFSTVKFPETVEVAINLGVDPRNSAQAVRGATVLPHGTGKSCRVAVFAEGPAAEAATAAGAERVGMDDLAQEMKAGQLNYDVVIATPQTMRLVGQLGQVLGPRGLMPNPKVGTVTTDVALAVKQAKTGQVRYRIDKAAIIHAAIGKVSFSIEALNENLNTLLADLRKLKPSSSKGVYFKKLTLSTTMGPGLVIEPALIR